MQNQYLEYVLDILSPLGDITYRSMFGGVGLYYRGLIFAIIADDVLYFKVSDDNRVDYEAMGSEPFTYMGKEKPVKISYWKVPEEIMENSEELQEWVEKAYQVSLKSEKKKPQKKS